MQTQAGGAAHLLVVGWFSVRLKSLKKEVTFLVLLSLAPRPPSPCCFITLPTGLYLFLVRVESPLFFRVGCSHYRIITCGFRAADPFLFLWAHEESHHHDTVVTTCKEPCQMETAENCEEPPWTQLQGAEIPQWTTKPDPGLCSISSCQEQLWLFDFQGR